MYYDYYLFDFDNTIVKTNEYIDFFSQRFIEENKLDFTDPRDLFNNIRAGGPSISKELFEKYISENKLKQPKEIEIYDGVIETIEKLQDAGKTLALVTSTGKDRVTAILNVRSIGNFSVLICAEDVENTKPHPEPILLAIKLLNADKSKCLYVGDSQKDVEAANAAGIDMCYINSNPHYTEYISEWLQNNKPKHMVDNFSEILEI